MTPEVSRPPHPAIISLEMRMETEASTWTEKTTAVIIYYIFKDSSIEVVLKLHSLIFIDALIKQVVAFFVCAGQWIHWNFFTGKQSLMKAIASALLIHSHIIHC